MNFVSFNPKNLSGKQREWWNEWSKKAEAETQKVLRQARNGGEIKFKNKIWTELKGWLLDNVFNGKCAYCESRVTDTGWGDADHYRPKRRVCFLNGSRMNLVKKDGKQHPGYFWLAYEWRNLLPSCKRCNSERKLNCFPVEQEYVFEPEECQDCYELDEIEKPLLLNPYWNGKWHPKEHLQFGKRGGVSPKRQSRMGKISIEVYRLRRSDLRQSRKEAQENGWLKYLSFVGSPPEREKFIHDLKEGKWPYSAAILDFIDGKIECLEADRKLINNRNENLNMA